MKDIKDTLKEDNALFIENREELTKILTQLVTLNYDTQGRYQKQIQNIAEALQNALNELDHMIDHNLDLIDEHPFINEDGPIS